MLKPRLPGLFQTIYVPDSWLRLKQPINEPRHVTSNNVVFLHLLTQTSLCSLFLSLETPNDVQSVAQHSYNMQATNKSSDRTALMRRLI